MPRSSRDRPPGNRAQRGHRPHQNGQMVDDAVDEGDLGRIVDDIRARTETRTLGSNGPFSRLLTFRVPSRFETAGRIDLDAWLNHIDQIIRARGLVLEDRQILTEPMDQASWIEAIYEPGTSHYDTPARTEWGPLQRAYFGLDNPRQMADEEGPHSWSHIWVRMSGPYLHEHELIIGLVDGHEDGRPFYCPCHFASVVYTTRNRVVCMSCGATHIVLAEALGFTPYDTLTAPEWADLFDEGGARADEEVDLYVVDFREIEGVPTIWTTSQWEEASHELTFFARSSADEVTTAI